MRGALNAMLRRAILGSVFEEIREKEEYRLAGIQPPARQLDSRICRQGRTNLVPVISRFHFDGGTVCIITAREGKCEE
ncbi:hypothetical protein P0136_01390 [Lentisphaerota bacterium ZTH]|nr:hypothetical protein JYG24_07470 [Lentisphaerota bacterium]WET06668.1 hypothetical protein P0136_01390 [Lentisphaerota bacterium ZTH]